MLVYLNLFRGYQTKEKPKVSDTINLLPNESLIEIFSCLNLLDLNKTSQVCAGWKQIIENNQLVPKFIYENIAIGQNKWMKNLGKEIIKKNTEEEDDFKALSKDIGKILLKKLPKSKKRVLDKYTLVWSPILEGKTLTLNTLGELMKKTCFPKTKKGYNFISEDILKELGDTSLESGWMLISKEVVKSTRNQSPLKHQTTLTKLSKKVKIECVAPRVLQVAVCAFAEYLNSEERLFSDDPLTYSLCNDFVKDSRIAIGNFTKDGFSISYANYAPKAMGMAPILKPEVFKKKL